MRIPFFANKSKERDSHLCVVNIFLLCKCGEFDILQSNLASLINVLGFVIVEDIAVFDCNVVYHVGFTVSHNTILASAYIYIADVDVLEV